MSTAPSTGLRLRDLDLRIGQTVQILTRGPQSAKHFTRLIGHADPDFLALRVPVENGWTVVLDEGQTLDVRVFCGVSLYEFESQLQSFLLHPRNYMLLSCPSRIEETRLRSHERVPCALPVRIVKAPGWSGADTQGDYRFQDLSGSGAALVGAAQLAEVGQAIEIELAFDLVSTGTHERLALGADVQSVQAIRNASGQTTAHMHGIRFHLMEPRILLLVSELQKRQAPGTSRPGAD